MNPIFVVQSFIHLSLVLQSRGVEDSTHCMKSISLELGSWFEL